MLVDLGQEGFILAVVLMLAKQFVPNSIEPEEPGVLRAGRNLGSREVIRVVDLGFDLARIVLRGQDGAVEVGTALNSFFASAPAQVQNQVDFGKQGEPPWESCGYIRRFPEIGQNCILYGLWNFSITR